MCFPGDLGLSQSSPGVTHPCVTERSLSHFQVSSRIHALSGKGEVVAFLSFLGCCLTGSENPKCIQARALGTSITIFMGWGFFCVFFLLLLCTLKINQHVKKAKENREGMPFVRDF